MDGFHAKLGSARARPPLPHAPAPHIHTPLLDALLRARTLLDTDDLCRGLHLRARQLDAELDRLTAAGCGLERHPHHGLRLIHTAPGAWADYLRWACPDPPDRIIAVYRQTASTQDIARQMIEAHAQRANGAIIVADEQTAGRGRLGRRWVAPAGTGVTFSRVAIEGSAAPTVSVDRMVFSTAIAVARGLEAAAGLDPYSVRIKWPNDLLIGGGKIAGILVESLPLPLTANGIGASAAIIGVGINVSLRPGDIPPGQPDLAARITSLAMCGHAVDRLEVLTQVLQHMDQTLAATDLGPLLDEWRRRSTILAQDIRFICDGRIVEGQVVDLDPYDGLIVRDRAGQCVHLPGTTTSVLDPSTG